MLVRRFVAKVAWCAVILGGALAFNAHLPWWALTLYCVFAIACSDAYISVTRVERKR